MRAIDLARQAVAKVFEVVGRASGYTARHSDLAAGASLASMKSGAFRLIVATNRPDIGNGVIHKTAAEEMDRQLAEVLRSMQSRFANAGKVTAPTGASPKRA